MFRFLLKIVREGLGRVIIFFDFITRPRPINREPEDQEKINKEVASMSLYQFYACPFCIKTRRAIHKLNLPISTKSAQDGIHREELQQGGGEVKVPCLRIEKNNEVTWMYESSDIINYLNERFNNTEAA